MKFKTEYLNFKTNSRHEFVNITSQVREIIEESRVRKVFVW